MGRVEKKAVPSRPRKEHASSNWKSIRSTLPKVPASVKFKRDHIRRLKLSRTSPETLGSATDASHALLQILREGAESMPVSKQKDIGKYLAIDCEMVGVGPNGCESALARVSIVNYYGAIIYDSYVKPKEKVTDYRTWVSGIKPEHLTDASTFAQATGEVARLIKDKVLIGHAITNDLRALLLKHPRPLLRDTSTYPTLRTLANTKFPSLKKLTALLLKVDIQGSAHCSVDDARATMAVYRTQRDKWESSFRSLTSFSTAPIFRKTSRPAAVQAPASHSKQPSPASKQPSPAPATAASSSKPSSPKMHSTNQLGTNTASIQVEPPTDAKGSVIQMSANKSKGKMKSTATSKRSNKQPTTTARLSILSGTKDMSSRSSMASSTTSPNTVRHASQQTGAPADLIRSGSPEFKKPRTTNLHLSATLQHIRNEEETSSSSVPQNSLPNKPPPKTGALPSSKQTIPKSLKHPINTASTPHQSGRPVKKRGEISSRPYERRPQSGNGHDKTLLGSRSQHTKPSGWWDA